MSHYQRHESYLIRRQKIPALKVELHRVDKYPRYRHVVKTLQVPSHAVSSHNRRWLIFRVDLSSQIHHLESGGDSFLENYQGEARANVKP